MLISTWVGIIAYFDILGLSGGGTLVAGLTKVSGNAETGYPGTKIWLLKLAADGSTIEWQRTYGRWEAPKQKLGAFDVPIHLGRPS